MYDAEKKFQEYLAIGATEDEARAVLSPFRLISKNPAAIQMAMSAKDKMSEYNAQQAPVWFAENPNSILANQRKGFYQHAP